MTDHDAELDALVAMLSGAGLVEEYVNEEGKETYQLTAKGVQVGRAMAMCEDDADAEAMLDALLDARERQAVRLLTPRPRRG